MSSMTVLEQFSQLIKKLFSGNTIALLTQKVNHPLKIWTFGKFRSINDLALDLNYPQGEKRHESLPGWNHNHPADLNCPFFSLLQGESAC